MPNQEEPALTLDRALWYGRTYREHSVSTVAETSPQFLKRLQKSQTKKSPTFLCLQTGGLIQDVSWEEDTALLGEFSTRSFLEYHNGGVESRLSQILQAGQLRKYYLSAKACQGILNRAERRGKELPEMLRIALEQQSASLNEPYAQGGKGILIQDDQTATLSTVNNQSVCYPINTMIATRGKALGRGTGFGVGDDGDVQFTLSTAHEHAVCYSSAGFNGGQSTGGLGYETEMSPTIRSESSAIDPTVVYPEVSRTLSARHDSSPCIDRGQEFICYGICADASNSMKSSNPHSGVYVAETSRTLDNNCGNPACNQGGIAVVERSETE